jgi:hypothetical protein
MPCIVHKSLWIIWTNFASSRQVTHYVSATLGLWRWYITITITNVGIIHRPLFYLKLNSIGLSVPHRKSWFSSAKPNRLMLSIGLWRWYINITITILDIIHRPVFYLKLKWTELDRFIRTSQKTHYVSATKPDRLMLSIGLWRWYINITITILDIICRPVLYLKLKWTQLYRFVPTSPEIMIILCEAQQVNAIYRFVMMVY